MTKRALMTGATGFIGSRLAGRLLTSGWEVHAVVREGSKLAALPEAIRERITFHVHTPENELTDILRRSSPDVVLHLASLFLIRHEYEDIPRLIESNITFGVKLLDAMAESGVKNFVNAGTAWQHYEDAAYSPVNLYAASKQAFSDMMRYYEEARGIRAITLVLTDTYGEGDPRRKLLPLLDETSRTGEVLSMSPGEQRIDMVHVDDVAAAFELSANYLLEERYELCGTYAVSSGKSLTLRELVRRYSSLTGKEIRVEWGGRPYREREVMTPWEGGATPPGWVREHTELM